MTENLLDVETAYAIQKAKPIVCSVPFDHATSLVTEMVGISNEEKSNLDKNGTPYWTSSMKRLATAMEITPKEVGTVCREIGLEVWRKGDGYHVAWSDEQLVILKKLFFSE